MPNPVTLRIIRTILQLGPWWPTETQPDTRVSRRPDGPILTLVARLRVGDYLFWHKTPSLSRAIFAIAIFAPTPAAPTPLPSEQSGWPSCQRWTI